eukprot:s2496_g8.t1
MVLRLGIYFRAIALLCMVITSRLKASGGGQLVGGERKSGQLQRNILLRRFVTVVRHLSRAPDRSGGVLAPGDAVSLQRAALTATVQLRLIFAKRRHRRGSLRKASRSVWCRPGNFPCTNVQLSAVSNRNGNAASSRARGRPGANAPEVTVISWNVLCPQLCTELIFPHSRLQDLDDDIRWGRVLKKLSEKVEENAVICLQELSQDWCARLHVFFLKSDYCLVNSNYGKEGDGYMGVAIAFPRRLYDLPAVSIKRVSEALPRHHSPAEGQGHDLNANSPSSWTISRSRQNRMISLRLRPRGTTYADKDFVVSTYHMPCFFRDMKVMVIHASLAAQCALEFAGDLPLILAGDFNFRPGSSPYVLLTNGSLPEEHHDHPGDCEAAAEGIEMDEMVEVAEMVEMVKSFIHFNHFNHFETVETVEMVKILIHLNDFNHFNRFNHF